MDDSIAAPAHDTDHGGIMDDIISAGAFISEFLDYYSNDLNFEAIPIREGDIEKVLCFTTELEALQDPEDPDAIDNDSYKNLLDACYRLKRLLILPPSLTDSAARKQFTLDSNYVDLVNNKFIPPSNWSNIGIHFSGYPLQICEKYVHFDRYFQEQNSTLWKDENGKYYLVWGNESIYEISCEVLQWNKSVDEINSGFDLYCKFARRDPPKVVNLSGDEDHNNEEDHPSGHQITTPTIVDLVQEITSDQDKTNSTESPNAGKSAEADQTSAENTTAEADQNISPERDQNRAAVVMNEDISAVAEMSENTTAAETTAIEQITINRNKLLYFGIDPQFQIDKIRVQAWIKDDYMIISCSDKGKSSFK